jgi:hypothetical protein
VSDPRVTVGCFMSGDRESLTVEAIGRFGVSFVYNDEASVIVHGDDLLKIRAIIDAQLSNWTRAELAAAPAQGGGE